MIGKAGATASEQYGKKAKGEYGTNGNNGTDGK
jgi:hypothetical protein